MIFQGNDNRPPAVRHARDASGTIFTRIVRDGRLRLDPPGIALEGIFGAGETR